MTETQLPIFIAQQLDKIEDTVPENPTESQRNQALSQVLRIIVEMVSMTSASLLEYDTTTYHSQVICEFDGKRSSFLERRSAIDEEYDEREFAILFEWLKTNPTESFVLNFSGLPHDSKERREFQSYSVQTSLYMPIFGADDQLWGYVELWESRYERAFTEVERDQLHIACGYLTKIIVK